MTRTCHYCQQPLTPAPNGRTPFKYHAGRCRKLGYKVVRNARLSPVPKRLLSILDDYTTVGDLAASRGVTVHAVFRWLRRNNLHCKPYFFVHYKKGRVRLDIAAAYAAPRAAKKPAGWVSLKSALAELPITGYQLVRRLEDEGRVEVVTFRKTSYISPESAALIAQTYRSSLPLPGWVTVGATAKRAGVTPSAVSRWARNHGVELRRYRNAEVQVFASYLEAKHAELYIALDEPRRGPRTRLASAERPGEREQDPELYPNTLKTEIKHLEAA